MSDSLQACEAVMLGGDADFLLCHHHDAAPGRLDTPAFRSLGVAEDRLVPMTATDDRGAPLWRLGADDRIPLMAYAPESGLGQAFEAVLGDRDGLNRVFTARLASTLLMSAGERLGIAWLPQSLLDAEPDHGLVRAGPADWDIPIAVRLFRRASRYQPDSETLWRLISRSVD